MGFLLLSDLCKRGSPPLASYKYKLFEKDPIAINPLPSGLRAMDEMMPAIQIRINQKYGLSQLNVYACSYPFDRFWLSEKE